MLIKGSLTVADNYVQLLGCGSGSTIVDFEPAITMTSVVITGTAGQFSCTCTNLAVGDTITISGTYGGTGSITGTALRRAITFPRPTARRPSRCRARPMLRS